MPPHVFPPSLTKETKSVLWKSSTHTQAHPYVALLRALLPQPQQGLTKPLLTIVWGWPLEGCHEQTTDGSQLSKAMPQCRNLSQVKTMRSQLESEVQALNRRRTKLGMSWKKRGMVHDGTF